jgi:glucosylceramidase
MDVRNVGPFSCGGVVTIDSQTREVTRSGQYWAFAHYARAFRRGARRCESESSIANLNHVAAENVNGEYAIVISNSGHARTVDLRVGTNTASIPLKPNSLTTLAWR